MASTTGGPPGPPRRPSSDSARALCDLEGAAHARGEHVDRRGSPTLCRLPAYSGPGLPRPTTSQRSSATIPPVLRPGGRRGRLGRRPTRRPAASVRTMPASASASASSASTCSAAGWPADDVDDQGLGVGDQLDARGQVEGRPGTGCRPGALDVDLEPSSGCGWPRPGPRRSGQLAVTSRPGAASPMTWTGDLDVDLLAAAHDSRSTCSMKPLIGSRWMSLGSASSCLPPSSSASSAFFVLQRQHRSWPGSVMCCGSVPCAVEDGGDLWSRRMRRAAPLPNSVRVSAAMLDLGHGGLLSSMLMRSAALRWLLDAGAASTRPTEGPNSPSITEPRSAPDPSPEQPPEDYPRSRSPPTPPSVDGRRAVGSAVAVEEAGDRAVVEDLADRAGDQRGDREHGQLVEAALRPRSAACW